MIAAVARWGNGLALRVSSALTDQISVHEGSLVDITVVDGALLVRPVDTVRGKDLEALLGRITDENRHSEITTG